MKRYSEETLTVGQMLEGTIALFTPKHNFQNIGEAKIWAKTNVVGLYLNKHTQESIRVSKSAIDKYLSSKAVEKSVNLDVHLSALKKLPGLIKTSILKYRQNDKENNPDIKEMQRFYGAVDYEKTIYPVKITVKAYRIGESKAYSYEVMKIESPTIDI